MSYIQLPEGFELGTFVADLFTFAAPVVAVVFLVFVAAVVMKALKLGS